MGAILLGSDSALVMKHGELGGVIPVFEAVHCEDAARWLEIYFCGRDPG